MDFLDFLDFGPETTEATSIGPNFTTKRSYTKKLIPTQDGGVLKYDPPHYIEDFFVKNNEKKRDLPVCTKENSFEKMC